MLAGIIGDTIGSVYEAHQWQEKDLDLFQPLPIEENKKIKPLFKNVKWVRKAVEINDKKYGKIVLFISYNID